MNPNEPESRRPACDAARNRRARGSRARADRNPRGARRDPDGSCASGSTKAGLVLAIVVATVIALFALARGGKP
jgi:hypothetical protein